MALKLKYTDENGILHIDMSPSTSPVEKPISDPKFDTINKRFGQYDIFGGKYEDGGETQSLFRSRYNSFEEELANTPYAFATERLGLNDPVLDITIDSRYEISPSKDLENDRFFERDDLFGPKIDLKKTDTAFTVTQLIHAQDRYFDLSTRSKYRSIDDSGVSKGTVRSIADSFEVKSAPNSAKRTVSVKTCGDAFKVLSADSVKGARSASKSPVVPTSKRKGETSFAIIAEPTTSRPTSPKSLPVEIRPGRVSPFKGRGFREETSRHNTPKTSAANSRSNSPPRRRTNSLSRIDKMATTATLLPPPPAHRPPRDFLKENMEEIRELSELNREKNEADAEKKRRDEEIALLKEMGILDKKGEVKSRVNSRSNSRSTSPSKINMRSRSNSPSAILHYENIPKGSSEYLNRDDGAPRPAVPHRSRLKSTSKSQPQSNDGSPKNSKIPKRQSSVSPTRSSSRQSRQSIDRNLNPKQRYMSNSTSSIHETIRIGSQVHDKRTSQSTQHLSISPSHIKGKPPISPGKSGPPPSNKSINPKRLSPIVGTPSKSPIDDAKPGSAKAPAKPVPAARKTAKTAGATPATSRLNSRQPSRTTSRDPSPEKRKTAAKNAPKPSNGAAKPSARTASTRTTQKPPVSNKVEPKKPVSRTNSVKNLSRASSTKALNEKPPLSRQVSKKDLSEKSKSTSKINEIAAKKSSDKVASRKAAEGGNIEVIKKQEKVEDKVDANVGDEITRQDNGTQYDKITNEKGELVILTKKNIVSMTTAAITSQPLEVVATVTNQLPTALEKAREKGMFERLSSKDSIVVDKDEQKEAEEKVDKEEKKPVKPKTNHERTMFTEDHVKLRPLQPPYNNPQVERVKQKIDSILKEPEISTENILAAAKAKEMTKDITEKAKTTTKEVKRDVTDKTSVVKDEIKKIEKTSSDIRSEAAKIVDSIMTPVEDPKEILEKPKDMKKAIEPIITVVSEKKNDMKTEIIETINETLVQGGPELEVQSSNLSTPGAEKMTLHSKTARGSASDKSHSNGGFPQSTSTTPKPPPRAHREQKDKSPQTPEEPSEQTQPPKPNICSRLMGKCKAKCCPCCTKPQDEDEREIEDREDQTEATVEKKKFWKDMNCCKKKVSEEDVEIAAGKGTTIEFEHEIKRKRKLRDILCACCRRRKVSDIDPPLHAEPSPPVMSSDVVTETGCCGKKKEVERRDSILSDQAPSTCCNNRLCRWLRGACRRQSEQSSSRRTSLFSKNKSLSPTLPPEDTRKKLDPSLIEHTSVMRGAIPVLPAVLAYFCLLCNICVPGLGTILSGMFCLCFGIPRFGVHDGAKHRIGSFVINLLVGCGQLFTVLFCLVGWGWSVWWGVIMVKTSRKYRKLKRDAAQEAEAPPVSDNNHRA